LEALEFGFFYSVGNKTFLTAKNSFPTQPQLSSKRILEEVGTVPAPSKKFKGKPGQQRRYDAPTYLKEPLEEVGTVPASSFNDIKEIWGDRREEFS